MITIKKLIEISKRIMDEPIGLGDPQLAARWETFHPYYRFLHAVMKEFRMKVAVECGVQRGVATEHMILSSEDSFIIGIDRDFHPEYLGVYERHPKNVVFLCADTTASGNRVRELLEGRTIDLLFIDSDHDGITPTKEFEQFSPMFSDVAVVCCDDTGYGEGMQIFWKWLPGEKVELNDLHCWQLGGAPTGFGVSVVRR